MLKLNDVIKKFVIKKGTKVIRHNKNGRRNGDLIALKQDLCLTKNFYIGIFKCSCCDTKLMRFAVGTGYMDIEVQDIIGTF